MIRRLIVSTVILLIASQAWSVESSRFKLDTIKGASYVSLQSTPSFNRLGILDEQDTLFRLNVPSKSYQSLFSQFFVSSLYAGLPYSVTFDFQPSVITLGESTVIDFQTSEELSNWAVQIDGILQLNTIYDNHHLFVTYTPIFGGLRTHAVNLSLTDMGWNTGQSTLNFTLLAIGGNGGQGGLIQTLITEDILSSVHQGRKAYPALVFDLAMPDYDVVFDGVRFNIDSYIGAGLFDVVSLFNPSTNEVVASLNVATNNSSIYLPLSSTALISTNNSRFELRFDVKTTALAGATFNVETTFMRIHTAGSVGGAMDIASSLNGGIITVIDKDQPIITRLRLDDYISVTASVTVNVLAEIMGPMPNQIRYHILDISSGNETAPVNMIYTPILVTGDIYALSNNVFAGFNLRHNHNHYFVAQLLAPMISDVATSNLFKVDLTPPYRPNQLKLQTFTLSSVGTGNQGVSTDKTGVKFVVDSRQWLDPESGLRGFEVVRKTSELPNWQVVASGNASTGNTTAFNFEEVNDSMYYYATRLQNRAGLWSELGDARELDLRVSGLLIVSLYNSPNPFDSRLQSTTIYYTLRENADVDFILYDMFGYLVRKWHFQSGLAGGQRLFNTFVWDATNQLGDRVSKGAYILFMKATDISGVSMQRKYSIGVIR